MVLQRQERPPPTDTFRWQINSPLIATGCAWYATPGTPENLSNETMAIQQSINGLAMSAQVDNRFVLAVMMQESRGCVRIQTTNGGHANPGLMQSYMGTWTCANIGNSTCSSAAIYGMLSDGVSGTAAGDGLAADLQQQSQLGFTAAQLYYRAARVYNSGRVASNQRLECGGATHCYASDIANRLTGWASNQASWDCPWVQGSSAPVCSDGSTTMWSTVTDTANATAGMSTPPPTIGPSSSTATPLSFIPSTVQTTGVATAAAGTLPPGTLDTLPHDTTVSWPDGWV